MKRFFEYELVLGIDGNKRTCRGVNFMNLQNSPCGFGDTFDKAVADYLKQIGLSDPQVYYIEASYMNEVVIVSLVNGSTYYFEGVPREVISKINDYDHIQDFYLKEIKGQGFSFIDITGNHWQQNSSEAKE